MLNLEELTLYLDLRSFKIFIDGNNLKENIINHLPRLNKFVFNILSVMLLHMKPYLPINEEISLLFSCESTIIYHIHKNKMTKILLRFVLLMY